MDPHKKTQMNIDTNAPHTHVHSPSLTQMLPLQTSQQALTLSLCPPSLSLSLFLYFSLSLILSKSVTYEFRLSASVTSWENLIFRHQKLIFGVEWSQSMGQRRFLCSPCTPKTLWTVNYKGIQIVSLKVAKISQISTLALELPKANRQWRGSLGKVLISSLDFVYFWSFKKNNITITTFNLHEKMSI